MAYRGTRYTTNLLLEMVDEGVIDPKNLAHACLVYMSEDEVADMARVNGYLEHLDEDLESNSRRRTSRRMRPNSRRRTSRRR
jgi:hypothetical protein